MPKYVKYTITYAAQPLAEVAIDESIALPFIKEMIEFWSGGERLLIRADGSFTKAWLALLALHILRQGQLPIGEEGWYPLDEAHGIHIYSWDPWEPDADEIEIE